MQSAKKYVLKDDVMVIQWQGKSEDLEAFVGEDLAVHNLTKNGGVIFSRRGEKAHLLASKGDYIARAANGTCLVLVKAIFDAFFKPNVTMTIRRGS